MDRVGWLVANCCPPEDKEKDVGLVIAGVEVGSPAEDEAFSGDLVQTMEEFRCLAGRDQNRDGLLDDSSTVAELNMAGWLVANCCPPEHKEKDGGFVVAEAGVCSPAEEEEAIDGDRD